MAHSNATVIAFPPYVAKLRMIELARWAWDMDHIASLRDTRSGKSLVILTPIESNSFNAYSEIFKIFKPGVNQ